MSIYYSKVDKSFKTIIRAAIVLVSLATLLPALIDPSLRLSGRIMLILLSFCCNGFILWLFYGLRYTFKSDCLIVRGGPFFSKIPYDSITKVAFTNDIAMGYRLLSSSDAIEISYKKAVLGSVKISPALKEDFMKELKLRCPHL